MLIHQKTADAWFSKDSFIFQQYIYLFRNPLWSTKKEPRGASLCPYFWMAMFSFFVFKPFVFIIQFLLKCIWPILILGGKPLAKFDKWIREWIDNRKEMEPGLGIAMLIVTLLCIFLVFLLIALLVNIYHSLDLFIGKFAFWGIFSGIIILFSTLIHYSNTKHDPKRCHSEVYIYLWAALTLVTSIIWVPKELLSGLNLIWNSIFAKILSGIFCFITFTWHHICFAFFYSIHYLWLFLTYTPYGYYIPWWLLYGGALAILGGVTYLIEKLLHYDSQEQSCNYIDQWKRYIHKVVLKYPHIMMVFEYHISKIDILKNLRYSSLSKLFIDSLIWWFIEDTCEIQLIQLKPKPFPYKLWLFGETTLDDVYDLADRLSESTKLKFNSNLFSDTNIIEWLDSVSTTPKFTNLVFSFQDIMVSNDQTFKQHKLKKENSKSRKLCKLITEKINSVIRKTREQISIASDYGIKFIKAKKQGACPYMAFKD